MTDPAAPAAPAGGLDRRIVPPVRTAVLLALVGLAGFVVRVDALRNDVVDAGSVAQQAVVCLAGALTVGLVGLVVRRLVGEVAGFVAALVVAVTPLWWPPEPSSPLLVLVPAVAVAVGAMALAVVDHRGSRPGGGAPTP